MLKDIEVGIPVDETGKININMQREIATKYLAIEQYRRDILANLDTLLNQRIDYQKPIIDKRAKAASAFALKTSWVDVTQQKSKKPLFMRLCRRRNKAGKGFYMHTP